MKDKCDLPRDEDTLDDFAKKLKENQEPLGRDFQEVLNQHYWDLLEGDKITNPPRSTGPVGPTGWVCPRCGRGNAPHTSSCPCIPPPPMKVTC
jgi:hypothetical protein